MVCILGMGDCGSSSQASTSLTNSTVNQNLTNVLSTVSSSVSTSLLALQKIKFLPCPQNPNSFVANCPNGFGVIQNISGKINIVTSITQDTATELANVINNQVKQNAADTANASSQFLSTASSTATTADNVANYITNLVSKNITSQTVNDIISQFDFTQEQIVYECGTWNASSCEFSQNMQLSLISDAIISTVNNLVSNDAYLNSLTQTGTGSTTSSAAGIQGFIDSIFSGLSGLLGTLELPLIIGLFIIILIIVSIVAIVLFRRKSTKNVIASSTKP
jgi:hypothetical protein